MTLRDDGFGYVVGDTLDDFPAGFGAAQVCGGGFRVHRLTVELWTGVAFEDWPGND